jgi:predicted kinase
LRSHRLLGRIGWPDHASASEKNFQRERKRLLDLTFSVGRNVAAIFLSTPMEEILKRKSTSSIRSMLLVIAHTIEAFEPMPMEEICSLQHMVRKLQHVSQTEGTV